MVSIVTGADSMVRSQSLTAFCLKSSVTIFLMRCIFSSGLMRVLAKPELDNAIILNELALIMENFGVPVLEDTISDGEDDYIPDGEEKPRTYDLSKIDEEGITIFKDLAKHLLASYLHPREFFGKLVKMN